MGNMKVTIWGSRGSLPASITAEQVRDKIFKALEASQNYQLKTTKEINAFIESKVPFSVKGCYGSNTSCVEIRGGKDHVLFDAGTGLRDFGNHIIRAAKGPDSFHILLSHLHWDHLQGFPFFIPAYIKDNRINFYGCHENLKAAFFNQQSPPYFPVPLTAMSADLQFTQLEPEKEYDIGGFRIKGMEQNHPGKSYSYCIKKGDKKIVYSTDSEHKENVDDRSYPFLQFIKNADLLILDTQYSLLEAIYTKENWGHSSNIIAVELAVKAGVKHLCMFHSEPVLGDETLDKILEDTKRYAELYADSYSLKISLAYDGLKIEV